ncbi:MAG: TetR/AcrR family transcriptional regulator C-terminal domain-containing protein [Eubacterium sp.]|nr:TetR/AcrR family transcriptional regulator C-terminal domain-containing protein [Eubacterium sp.]
MSDNLITKRAIVDALKELTQTKTFDKISVKDISLQCGINRQTFYYHFEDKFILLKWIYEHDLFENYMKDVSFDNWTIRLEELLTAMTKEKAFYVNTINHTENYIQEYLLVQTQDIFKQAINVIDESANAGESKTVSAEQRDFIARFFAYGSCGILIEWVSRGMIEEPGYITNNMKTLKDLCERASYDFLSDKLSI